MMIRCLPARVGVLALLAAAGCGDSSPAKPRPDAAVQPDAPVPDAASPDAAPDAGPKVTLQIKTLSNRADLLSGGDALIEIVIPSEATGTLHVTAGATDVSSAFARRSDNRTTGLVTGLPVGPTDIKADLSGDRGTKLTVTNHPIGGPVISGPQILPWVCATPVATPGDATTPATVASGLSTAATDDQCNIATEFKLYYRTTTPGCTLSLPDPNPSTQPPPASCFKPYDPAAPVPADLAMTTTDTNVTVPYIVRIERGTLNRGIFDIAVLFDPTQVGPDGWKPTAPPTTWNRKLLYVFGPATGQPRRQQRSSQVWAAQDEALKRGFLVAVSNMTDSALNSNRVSMTESLMMMKEHIIDSYGEIRYAMGAGCSGGSINQLTSSSIFPGLLDGIQPSCTYPDSETTGVEVADCEGLVRVYASDAWRNLMVAEGQDTAQNNAKQAAINGHLDQVGCRSWFNSFIGVARPGNYVRETVGADGTITQGAVTNNCTLPAALVYDPVNNPTGARCTGPDHAISIWGKVAGVVSGTERAPSTRDNVGVVYGLKAFQSHAITPEEFVLVNELVGGADADLVRTTARSVADTAALPIAYRAGIVMDARQLARTAIIDLRGFDESGIHYIWRSFSLRARLDAVNGHGNHVLWRFPGTLTPSAASGLTLASFLMMDRWLTALRAHSGNLPLEQRIVATKPSDAFDFCYLSFDTGFTLKVQDPAVCNLDPGLKPHSSPRQVAGGPVTEDILKCQLKPFVAADYPGLSDAQLARLQAVFPDGVCDWSKPGVGQQPAVSPLDFTAGPGGVPLPAPPTSQPL